MTLEIVFAILIVLAFLLSALPTIPGVPFMFVIVFVYGLIDGFEMLTPTHLAIFGAMAAASLIVDYTSGLIGAKLGGANKRSLLFGFAGLIVGLIMFPPLGALIGLFLGIFLAEFLQVQDSMKALKAASFSVATAIAGTAFNVLLGIAFLITFFVIVF